MQKKSISDLAYDILENNHRPMHYRKITEEVMKIKDIKAENPHHDVNALMGADQRFIRYQRGIWGLVKWKYREAHLPYNLTSYCLRNGTIFLTSYLRPYFSWSREDREMEIIFIDDDGEEIKGQINYRKKLIFGLREWYQKKKLDVNDTIYIGLIDENKKRYFIIPEKDVTVDAERDIEDAIYQILKEQGEPLSYSQIYASLVKQDPDQQGLFDEYIQNILRRDARFVEIQKDRWGLAEWLDEVKQLYLKLLYSEDASDFQFSLKQCFDYLGYRTELLDHGQHTLIIARADLDYKSYCLILIGLPKGFTLNMVRAIDWPGIKKIRDSMNSDSVILFSEKFSMKELVDRASEEGVQIYEIAILFSILKEHQHIPFSLFELRTAFSPMHHPGSNHDKLMQVRETQWKQWSLCKDIFSILRTAGRRSHYMDMNLLVKELVHVNPSFQNNQLDQIQVKKMIVQLSQEPFKLVEYSESGNIILAYAGPLAEQKMHSLFQFIMGGRENKSNDIIVEGNHV